MDRKTFLGLASACCLALIVLIHPMFAAVKQQKPSTEPTAPPETVLTGCLRSHGADTAIAGPSGRLYTLEVVEMAQPASPTPSTPTGTPLTASATTYSLDNIGNVELEKHADHEVELTGRMQTPSKAQMTSPTGQAIKLSPGGGHRTFHVMNLKMIAAKCKPAG
jgi:hypothetical protein